MKKLFSLLILGAIAIWNFNINAMAEEVISPTKKNPCPNAQMKKEFEQRLNLTDKQKEKAKAIHEKGREQIKPIFAQIELKRKEIEAVKLSRIAPQAQEEKILELNTEIRVLEKKAQDIRKENSKEFENILNKKQKNELAKMKAEGRARFEKNHPARPPFSGLGGMSKPLFRPYPPDFTSK